ncbi:hypothetical protein HII31_00233 [Pseudocercospora fuligena]|uniref:NTF2-like domain-containing protein n=1 Tax=Pseudocercospora fuligena TaxID=685502 RepID=A0A8H6VS21_9PEZI|nr:hypothetical protein HII31_00233 [Pseudocercospora fuligena]
MLFIELLTFASLALGALSAVVRQADHGCLDDGEALDIATRWTPIFATDDKGNSTTSPQLFDSTIADNFTYWNEGDFYSPIALRDRGLPQPRTKADFRDFTKNRRDDSATNRKSTVEYVWHNCENIFLRFVATGEAAATNRSLAPAGTPFHYKGSNHMVIDRGSRLIHNVTSSSDIVYWVLQMGFKDSPADLYKACEDPKEEGCGSEKRKRDVYADVWSSWYGP